MADERMHLPLPRTYLWEPGPHLLPTSPPTPCIIQGPRSKVQGKGQGQISTHHSITASSRLSISSNVFNPDWILLVFLSALASASINLHCM
jgi:hypothetical protein